MRNCFPRRCWKKTQPKLVPTTDYIVGAAESEAARRPRHGGKDLTSPREPIADARERRSGRDRQAARSGVVSMEASDRVSAPVGPYPKGRATTAIE
jgi:hypothetical protein